MNTCCCLVVLRSACACGAGGGGRGGWRSIRPSHRPLAGGRRHLSHLTRVHGSPERLSDVPQVTQLARGRAGLWGHPASGLRYLGPESGLLTRTFPRPGAGPGRHGRAPALSAGGFGTRGRRAGKNVVPLGTHCLLPLPPTPTGTPVLILPRETDPLRPRVLLEVWGRLSPALAHLAGSPGFLLPVEQVLSLQVPGDRLHGAEN